VTPAVAGGIKGAVKERLVKGRQVLAVVGLLEGESRTAALPELSPLGADLLCKPLYPTTWYQLRAFDDLLQSVHRYVFDGSEATGQRMGRLLAQQDLNDPRSGVRLERTPLGAGAALQSYWKAHFNFGQVEYEPHTADGAEGVRIRLTGFPDMSACHGLVLMGWCAEAMEVACGGKAHLRVEERPWMHHGVLSYTLTPG